MREVLAGRTSVPVDTAVHGGHSLWRFGNDDHFSIDVGPSPHRSLAGEPFKKARFGVPITAMA